MFSWPQKLLKSISWNVVERWDKGQRRTCLLLQQNSLKGLYFYLSFFNIARGCHTVGVSCLVSSFLVLFLKSNSFPVLFWIVTLLSFQVTCPSSCVTGLIVFPDSWLCPPVPSSPMCSYSLRLPSSCASVSSYVLIPALILDSWTIAIVTLALCLLSIPPVEWLLFVAFCFSV